jgi:dynein heavy chain
LEALNKKDITEIKSYGKPPALVETVLQAVMILRGNEPTWAEAKRQLGKVSVCSEVLPFVPFQHPFLFAAVCTI